MYLWNMLIFYQVLIIYYIKSLLLLFMTVAYWASLIAQLVKNSSAVQETPVDSWVRKICWRRNRVPTPVFFGLPYGSAGKESACNAGDLGSIPELGRSPSEGKGYALQYCGLENPKSQTWLSDFHFHRPRVEEEIKGQNRGPLLEEANFFIYFIIIFLNFTLFYFTILYWFCHSPYTLLKSQFICGSKHQLSSQVV